MRLDRRTSNAEYGALSGLVLALPLMALVCVFLVYPLLYLIRIAFGGGHALENLAVFFGNSVNIHVILITFLDSAITGLICVALGSLLAWSLRTSNSNVMKGVIWAAMILPFCMGTVTKLYALTVMLETHGVINSFLTTAGFAPLQLLYNQYAVMFGLTYQMIPFAVLPLFVAFQTIDLDLPRAAEGLGAGRLHAILDTIVPLSLPSMLASWAIIYILCSGFFLTPVLLGGITAPFASSLISQAVFQFYNVDSAAVSACILLVAGALVVAVTWVLVGRKRLAKAVAV